MAHLDLKGGYPRTARIQTFQTYPDGLPTALEGIRWIDGVDACFGIGLVFVIGYRRKIYRVLYAIDRRILYREIKDRLAIAVIVAGCQRILQGGVGRIWQRDHDELQLHYGVARKELRRHVVRYPREHDLAVGHRVGVRARQFCSGNGIDRFLLGPVI